MLHRPLHLQRLLQGLQLHQLLDRRTTTRLHEVALHGRDDGRRHLRHRTIGQLLHWQPTSGLHDVALRQQGNKQRQLKTAPREGCSVWRGVWLQRLAALS